MEKHRTVRLILYVFVLTFIAARILVYMIMDRLIPDLYLHVQGTHVHHLNYGIFLLSGVGAYLLIQQPQGVQFKTCTVLYAIGLALTFDEFGMWLHLGGPYWQRASFDAMTTISAALAFLAYSPDLKNWPAARWREVGILAACLCVFGFFLANSLKHAKTILTWKLQQIEAASPQ